MDFLRLPQWLRRPINRTGSVHNVKKTLRGRRLTTVCEEAKCPNIETCFSKPTATFMILGSVCTRTCGFCNVDKNKAPEILDSDEPLNLALTAKDMGLKHVVVTSVNRDDLHDGGAEHFVKVIDELRIHCGCATVEVLTPDFDGNIDAVKKVFKARPDIFNHNVETVKRLYGEVRPEADYETSLKILRLAKKEGLRVKSGLMVGLGETFEEVICLLKDLKEKGDVDIVTIGQYMMPSKQHLPVKEYIEPKVFTEYAKIGRELGIEKVYAGPYVRSSYNAEQFA